MRHTIPIRVSTEIHNAANASFNYIVPVPLSRIFTRYLLIPGVVKTDESEHWFKAGLTRTVYFEDGSTAKESLEAVVPPQSFSYKISDFTNSMRFLVDHIEGTWHFHDAPQNGSVHITWTYTVFAKNSVSKLIIIIVLAPMLRQVLQRAISRLKRVLDR